ncbi:oxidoreductase [Phaeosphaeria sp. MPI-PUGE-AT-0046c]|nr:oxidoreductase [Phaeosphaeria sp. MPI-PUGE-AT-0046c]
MSPIRVGLIGLSSVDDKSASVPGGWAATAHLPYFLKSPHYEITALCNSSVESAEAAIKRHSLPLSTKAYASAEDLAKDPNVDLVVCCVCVGKHHDVIMPALQAGKAAFVEWPLASNLEQAEELLVAAKKSGSKTLVGLQSRASPVVQKVKDLVSKKAIGELISSNFTFAVGMPGDTNTVAAEYIAYKKIGAGLLSILGAHSIDAVQYALGGLDEVSAHLSTRWSDVNLTKVDGSVERTIKRETPDHVLLHAIISGSNAPLSLSIRHGQTSPNAPNLIWSIMGTKGEIRVTSASALNLGLPTEKIEVLDFEKNAVETVEASYAEEVKDFMMFANNVGTMYELHANGGCAEQGLVDFEQAVAVHKIIDAIERSSEGKKWEKVVL